MFEYIKSLSLFIKQVTFFAIPFFITLLFCVATLGIRFVDLSVKTEGDRFLLSVNLALQIAFYGIYAIAGAARFLFRMNLIMFYQFKYTAARLDEKAANALDNTTAARYTPSGSPGDIENLSGA